MPQKPSLATKAIAATAAIGAAFAGVVMHQSGGEHHPNVHVATDMTRGMYRTPMPPTDDGKHRPPAAPDTSGMDSAHFGQGHSLSVSTSGSNRHSVLFRANADGQR